MTTVTSLTADRMLAIEAASVVDGDVIGGNLILTKHDGSQINAGSVVGPTGPQGPQGALLPVISGVPVLDVGLANQIRAGRQLTAADFTNMGLSAPLGLWNLSDLTDVSGNGRNLLNKGAVPFGVGINGGANTAAQFSGSLGQAFYIPDTGAADPFRIKTGSIGCWFKTAKRDVTQAVISKFPLGAGQYSFTVQIINNTIAFYVSTTGNDLLTAQGYSDVADNYWHFVVGVNDGTNIFTYVDANLEKTSPGGIIFPGSAPLNIANQGADSGNNGTASVFGFVDESFITADVLSGDQVRNLYCVKLPHTLAAVPSRVSLNVHRRRKGATLAVADFPTQPLRLYNFSGGSLGDEGSNGVALAGSLTNVAGVDGSAGNAFNFNGGQAFSATDAGLPAGLASRSYGCWIKTLILSAGVIMAWGSASGVADARMWAGGGISSASGADLMTGRFVSDGQWHHIVTVEDNAAIDGVKRKLYMDGRLTANSTTLNSINLGGAAHFRVGNNIDNSAIFTGQIDGVFVCDYALTADRIAQLYAKGSQTLASSPKNPGDHIEAMSSANLLATFDTLESQHTIDLGVEP